MRTTLILISTSLWLTGCSSYQEQFDCPAGVGVGCKSLASVDQMIDQGVLPQPLQASNQQTQQIDHLSSPEVRFISMNHDDTVTTDGVQRMPEQVMRIWMRGYSDAQGNYHGPSTVYTVVRPAQWHVADPAGQQPIQLQPGA